MGTKETRQRIKVYLSASGGIFMAVSLVLFPEQSFEAAVQGLDIWWNVVFPALLPFFIAAEILIGLGVVHFMGVLLEPFMRPLFNVPGEGSFVMAMGLASGFPIGSILTTRLREQNLCSKVEGERLMSFTNTADPLFMFGAVAVGMFGNAGLGITIAAAHYLSSLSVGLVMRFYRHKEKSYPSSPGGYLFRRALDRLYQARRSDGRPLGQLMGDAIKNSVNTLLLIGGFIILFSVILQVLEVAGVLGIFQGILVKTTGLLGLHPGVAPALTKGFFEVSLGCQEASKATLAAPLAQKVIAASAIIAWSGLSVHAQVASIISKSDLSIIPYSAARLLHGLLAALYTFILLKPAENILQGVAVPVFLYTVPQGSFNFWYDRVIFFSGRMLLLILILVSISVIIYLYTHLVLVYFRYSRK